MSSIFYSFFVDKLIFVIILVFGLIVFKKGHISRLIFFLITGFFLLLLINSFLAPSLKSSLNLNNTLNNTKWEDVRTIQLVKDEILIKEFKRESEIVNILNKLKSNKMFTASHGPIINKYSLDIYLNKKTVSYKLVQAKAGMILYLQNYKNDKYYDVACYKNDPLGFYLEQYTRQ